MSNDDGGKEVIRAGTTRPPRQHPVYEKTTSDTELISGRVYMKGTADKQHKKYNALGREALGVFGRNLSHPAYVAASELFDSDYAYDGRDIEGYELSDIFIFRGTLLDGETIVKGKLVSCSVAAGHEGKIIAKLETNTAIGVALESKVASGADELVEILFLGPIGGLAPISLTEVLTGSGETITLTHSPLSIDMIDMTAGETTGAFVLAGTAASGISVSIAGKVITFNAADTPTTVSVRYTYLPGGN